VIRKCTVYSQRFKGSKDLASEILWTQRDLQTGVDYHFVGKRGHRTGRWSSSVEVDLGQLCLERSRRRQLRLDAMAERLCATKENATSNNTSKSALQKQPAADEVLENHKKEIKAFIKKYGVAGIPPGQLEALRVTTSARLTSIYTLNRIAHTDALISADIMKAEVDAAKNESGSSTEPKNRFSSQADSIAANAVVSSNPAITGCAACKPPSLHKQTPVAPGGSQAGNVSQVVAEHITGIKNLTQKYGVALIPLDEFDALRQRNERNLAVAFRGAGINVGRSELNTMLTS